MLCSPGRYPGVSWRSRNASRRTGAWPSFTRKNKLNSLVEPTVAPGRAVAGAGVTVPHSLQNDLVGHERLHELSHRPHQPSSPHWHDFASALIGRATVKVPFWAFSRGGARRGSCLASSLARSFATTAW